MLEDPLWITRPARSMAPAIENLRNGSCGAVEQLSPSWPHAGRFSDSHSYCRCGLAPMRAGRIACVADLGLPFVTLSPAHFVGDRMADTSVCVRGRRRRNPGCSHLLPWGTRAKWLGKRKNKEARPGLACTYGYVRGLQLSTESGPRQNLSLCGERARRHGSGADQLVQALVHEPLDVIRQHVLARSMVRPAPALMHTSGVTHID